MAFTKTGWVPIPRRSETVVGDLQAPGEPKLYEEAARAVEALLRNPIQFVPATKRTYEDMKTTSPVFKSNISPESSTMAAKNNSINGADISVRPPEAPVQNSTSQSPEISARWQRQSASPSPPKGFSNAHVMCYRNSMIQALLHIPKLVNWLEENHDTCPKENRCTICAFQRLSLLYWQTQPNAKDVNQSMASLTANLKTTATLRTWRWSRQQDANEFYMFLVNAMIERHSSSEKTLKTLLGHQTARTTICDLSFHRSRVVSPFEYRLGVPIRKDVRLEDILKTVTFAPANVSDYECEKCKKKGKATQHSRLTTSPDILAIDFLRFQQTGRGLYKKNSLHVPFPSSLDLSAFSEGKPTLKYQLLSVVQHMGSFANGHYRCIAKSPSGAWEELDDSSVRRSRISEAINPGGGWTPYSLFYARAEDNARLDGHVNGDGQKLMPVERYNQDIIIAKIATLPCMTASSPNANATNLTDLLLHNLANLPTTADPPPPHASPTSLNLTAAKPTLLTLHALYPTILLPALDVLDRRLITRLDLPPPPPSPRQPPGAARRSTYHVRSAAPSQRAHRRPGRDPVEPETSGYEVRTTAWSCTCAAFAFAAFNPPHVGHGGADPFGGEDEMMDMDMYERAGEGGGAGCDGIANTVEGMGGAGGGGASQHADGKGWGGLMRGYEAVAHVPGGRRNGVPVCKHLLACVVAEWWDGAAQMVEVRVVETGEMAGWAGGWGG